MHTRTLQAPSGTLRALKVAKCLRHCLSAGFPLKKEAACLRQGRQPSEKHLKSKLKVPYPLREGAACLSFSPPLKAACLKRVLPEKARCLKSGLPAFLSLSLSLFVTRIIRLPKALPKC